MSKNNISDELIAPKFNDQTRDMKIDSEDFTTYYSNEFPYVEYEIKELSEYAKENNIFEKLIGK